MCTDLYNIYACIVRTYMCTYILACRAIACAYLVIEPSLHIDIYTIACTRRPTNTAKAGNTCQKALHAKTCPQKKGGRNQFLVLGGPMVSYLSGGNQSGDPSGWELDDPGNGHASHVRTLVGAII